MKEVIFVKVKSLTSAFAHPQHTFMVMIAFSAQVIQHAITNDLFRKPLRLTHITIDTVFITSLVKVRTLRRRIFGDTADQSLELYINGQDMETIAGYHSGDSSTGIC